MIYKDRVDAGVKLAEEIKKLMLADVVVLCIPRGGVVVGAQIAKGLNAPLDIVVPKKIGNPANQEIAIGAVAQDGSTYLNEQLIPALGIKDEHLLSLVKEGVEEIERRMNKYRGSTDYPDFGKSTLVIVDDGAATGYTMLAAAEFIRKSLKSTKTVIAVPVAPPEVLDLFENFADVVVCPYSPQQFHAVGQFYFDFCQTTDREVMSLLKAYRIQSEVLIFS